MSRRRRKPLHHFFFLFSNACLLLLLCFTTSSASSSSPAEDARALLDFKSMADLNGNLKFEQNTSSHFCQWLGVTCVRVKVVRLVLEGLDLGGVFAPNTLTRLDQLRVLSLQNNSLVGPIPNLSGLLNLKSLFLDHNSFTGFFPPSISLLHRIRTLDFSYNNLTGPIPAWLIDLDRLYYLRLEWNRFNGTVPPLNQSSLQTFNVSGNSLAGAIPVTSTFLHFGPSSFSWNPNLCGEIIHKECRPGPPFFRPSPEAAPPPAVAHGQTVQVDGVQLTQPCQQKNHRRTMVIIGFSSGIFVLIGSLLLFVIAFRKQKNQRDSKALIMAADEVAATACAMQMEQETELEEKVKRMQEMQVGKSGSLVFSAGEAQVYTLDQLMRASAEMLGRGTVGTTYKAVLDNRLIVCVKRLDAGKLAGTSKDTFEQHMESVGGLRHPNLVPLRAYFQAKEERLLIYDYQPNGSLSSLIHGSKSTRAKPLHWTSCLKIAEDVAQGLSYIHQAWRLVHGNLKSSNVLLGPDFEACVADYCLAVLATTTSDDPDFTSYKAPEIRDSKRPATPKSDVYAFGILLLELLTGKPPSQHPFWATGEELMHWVKSVREDDGGGEDERLAMLLEVAVACSLSSPDQRPTMWQVLKMIQEIKEVVLMEDSELESHHGMS